MKFRLMKFYYNLIFSAILQYKLILNLVVEGFRFLFPLYFHILL